MTTKLHISAASSGSVSHFAKLLRSNVDVNVRDEHGNTPLMLACRPSHLTTTVVKFLIENGAEINAANADGDTALMVACRKGNTKTAKLLIRHGADVNAANNNGYTALIMACIHTKDKSIVKYLIEYGANINAANKDGDTALMAACRKETTNVAKLLIRHGADVNAANNKGHTALIMTCSLTENTDLAKYLIERGADSIVFQRYPLIRMLTRYRGFGKMDNFLDEHGVALPTKDIIQEHRAMVLKASRKQFVSPFDYYTHICRYRKLDYHFAMQ